MKELKTTQKFDIVGIKISNFKNIKIKKRRKENIAITIIGIR